MTERGEIEIMLRRLEELRRTARSNDLRGAYKAAIDRLDAAAYRLAQLQTASPAPLEPKAIAAAPSAPPAKAPATRIVVARKPRR